MRIIIRNGTIVNYNKKEKGDILIEQGLIKKIGKNINLTSDCQIDASGKFIFPGFFDVHTHLRTPGREDEEDIKSGSLAAAKGGFTRIFCMPNTEPPLDNEAEIKALRERIERESLIDIIPVGAITLKREGKVLTEFGNLKKAGCPALSDDGSSLKNSLILRRAFEYAKMFGLTIISHCEDEDLSSGGSIREGGVSALYGLRSIPSISESIIVARDIEIAQYLKVPLHLAHISTKRSVEIIEEAKKRGAKITCETAPHYFVLTDEDIAKSKFNSNFKVNPPLGSREDRESIKRGLKEGIIDCIATDHAPHSLGEKELPFSCAPFGMIGLEFAFSLTYTYLAREGILSLEDIARLLSYKPSGIFGFIKAGEIKEGYEGSLVIVDLNKQYKVCEEEIVSKSKNTPFLGSFLWGVVEKTIYKGKIVYER